MQAEAERLSTDPPQRTRDARACQFAGRGQARSIDLWLSRLYGLESICPHSTPKNRSAVDRATSKPSKRKVSTHVITCILCNLRCGGGACPDPCIFTDRPQHRHQIDRRIQQANLVVCWQLPLLVGPVRPPPFHAGRLALRAPLSNPVVCAAASPESSRCHHAPPSRSSMPRRSQQPIVVAGACLVLLSGACE